MKNFLKQLFIHLPLLSLLFLATVSLIIPVGFWLITGDAEIWFDYIDKIIDL